MLAALVSGDAEHFAALEAREREEAAESWERFEEGRVYVLSEFLNFNEQEILGVYTTLTAAQEAVRLGSGASWEADLDDGTWTASIFEIKRADFYR